MGAPYPNEALTGEWMLFLKTAMEVLQHPTTMVHHQGFGSGSQNWLWMERKKSYCGRNTTLDLDDQQMAENVHGHDQIVVGYAIDYRDQ